MTRSSATRQLARIGGVGSHVVMLDPPAAPLRTYGAMTHLAWGEPELRFALQIHEREYALRASLTATYRALRAAGGAGGEELETLLRGDAKTPRPASSAGRILRVLVELGLVSLDPDEPDRDGPGGGAHRARAVGGVPGISAAL